LKAVLSIVTNRSLSAFASLLDYNFLSPSIIIKMNINEIATKADIDKIIDMLEQIKEGLKSAPAEKPILRSADVKRLLNVSDSTLQRLRISGAIKGKKIGGVWFYDMDQIRGIISK